MTYFLDFGLWILSFEFWILGEGIQAPRQEGIEALLFTNDLF
jgi:hypothetical protein